MMPNWKPSRQHPQLAKSGKPEPQVVEQATPLDPHTHVETRSPDHVAPRPVSAILYLTGLFVTLCGIFAVNYGLGGDTSFALQSFGLVCVGYAVSYYLRVHQISLRAVQVPLSICIILGLLAAISGNGVAWLVPAGASENRIIGVEVMIVWIAIVHSFLLYNDASLLLTFVPAATMLALVSSQSTDPIVLNAFLLLLGAGTFLTIHEMYLRTNNPPHLVRRRRSNRDMYAWQLILAAVCIGGALLLANVLVLPIKTIGQALFDPSNNGGLTNTIQRTGQAITGTKVQESRSLTLAIGPTTESDIPVMKVKSNRGSYWRGSTFSIYDGHSFSNVEDAGEGLSPENSQEFALDPGVHNFQSIDSPAFEGGKRWFVIPVSPYDIPISEMKGSATVQQHFHVITGNFANIYAAGVVRTVGTTLGEMRYNQAGTISASITNGLDYDVVSQVPTEDYETLRQLTADDADGMRVSEEGVMISPAISQAFKQLPKPDADTPAIMQIVQDCIANQHSDYGRADAIRKYISTNCRYNLQADRAPQNRDVVAWFLLTSKEGYCDSFAAATVVLCRYAGLPARLSSGFLKGIQEEDGTYTVRLKDKHVWAEVFFPRVGWVPFDATDGSIDISNRTNPGRRRVMSFTAWITSHGILPPVLCVVILLCLIYVIKVEVLDRQRSQRMASEAIPDRAATSRSIIEIYVQAERILERVGLERAPYQTPIEYLRFVAGRVGETVPELLKHFEIVSQLHGSYRYSANAASSAEVNEAKNALAAMRELVKQVPRLVKQNKSNQSNSK